ncbi:hypothetical protein [Thermochromatium tepidum]|uniref:Uncharacterized protein n=1 Tax=Thermochromatium tepidum ATCC 43061 TaxID=316276 RepID=A0A6I6E8J0_THETI|nr:hypothetical protein [Thermochromatium tepidum]QGU32878.1 hypothetical protein E6P07_07720 [Thermochromatium tepidum ATCC 43061]
MMMVKQDWIRRRHVAFAGVLGLVVCGQGCAEDLPRPPDTAPPPGPPRAAIDACLYKAASATCYFEDGLHAITGTCQERGRDWVCVPDRPPPGGRSSPSEPGGTAFSSDTPPPSALGKSERPPRPPHEAFVACLGLTSGSACLIQTPRGEVAGRCATDPQGLVCIPSNPPPPLGGKGLHSPH